MGRHERARQEGPAPRGRAVDDYLDRDVAGTAIVERKNRVAALDAAGKRLGTFETDREAMRAILTAARAARAAKR